MSLMVDQVSSMGSVLRVQSQVLVMQEWKRGVTRVLLVSERDISQSKYRLLFSVPEVIVDSRKQTLAASLNMCPRTPSAHILRIGLRHFMKYAHYFTEYFMLAHAVVPRPFPPKGLGTDAEVKNCDTHRKLLGCWACGQYSTCMHSIRICVPMSVII